MKKHNINILHISFHTGCKNELEYVVNKLGYNIEFMNFDDGQTYTNAKYNIGHDRANLCWNKHKKYFEKFDLIITSDTAPISRVFLQNNFPNKLIIWICNRFDYCDKASLDCKFPDKEYYELFKQATKNTNVQIIGYTPFENYYSKHIKKIDISDKIIKPIGKIIGFNYSIRNNNETNNMFFVPPYHNDTITINLSEKLNELNILNKNGRYNGMQELQLYKGIIHIPYAWSNFALFEALQFGIIYFIPSFDFLLEIKKNTNFFWSPPIKNEWLKISEWYCDTNKEIFVYFDSWDDLKVKVNTTNYNEKKKIIIEFAILHEQKQLNLWKNIFDYFFV